VGAEAEVRRQDAIRFLASASGTYDLVFIDPPYDSAVRAAGPLSERLPAVLTQEARIVTESDKRAPLELTLPLELERVYGDTRVAIHRA
jgi:16S rRNA (guanine966-N2)-methyltransferase